MVPLDAWRSQSYINPNRIGNENGNQLGHNSIYALGNELEWGKILFKSNGEWEWQYSSNSTASMLWGMGMTSG